MKIKKTVFLLSILLFQFISFGQLEANQKNFKSAVLTMTFCAKLGDPSGREFLEEAEQNGIVKYNLEGSFEEKKYAWTKFILENHTLCVKNIESDYVELMRASCNYGLRYINERSNNDPNKEFFQKLLEGLKESKVKISYIDNDRLNQFQDDFTNKLSTQSMTNSVIDILFYCKRMSTENDGIKFIELIAKKNIVKFNRDGQVEEMIGALKKVLSYGAVFRFDISQSGWEVFKDSKSQFGLRYEGEMMISAFNPITENDLWFIDQKKRLKVTEINDKELQKFIKEYSKNKK
jgi:hypothetical protein